MKAIALLFSFLLFGTASVAQEATTKPSIGAFNLVNAAYRGQLKEYGIPAYAKLDQAYRGGQITAADLIQAGIKANRLSETALEDSNYLHAVELNLTGLVTR